MDSKFNEYGAFIKFFKPYIQYKIFFNKIIYGTLVTAISFGAIVTLFQYIRPM